MLGLLHHFSHPEVSTIPVFVDKFLLCQGKKFYFCDLLVGGAEEHFDLSIMH